MADTNDMNLNLVWNTLMFFAHPDSYVLGERTGGVLQGCPRKPPPSPHEMAGFAKLALGALREYVGGDAEQWMLDGKPAPTASADAVLAEVAKWALAGHITEAGVTVEAGQAIRAVASGVIASFNSGREPS